MGGEPYGARFRRADQPADDADVLGDDSEAARTWPRWLPPAAAVLAAAVVLTVVVRTGGDPAAPEAEISEPERIGPAVTIVRNTPPPEAPLELAAATSEQWPTRGYSYFLDLDNPTQTDYVVLDVGFPVQGAEIAWDESLLISGEATTRLTVDFLVNNCAAVRGRPAPEELRLTLRPSDAEPGEAGTVALMHLDLREASADLAAAGGVKCDADRPVMLG